MNMTYHTGANLSEVTLDSIYSNLHRQASVPTSLSQAPIKIWSLSLLNYPL